VIAAAPRRVLFVDDEPGLRAMAEYALRPLGYDLTTAVDGAEAVALVAAAAFDVVILDVAMPRMNGLEARARIRALRPSQRVVFVTGSAGLSEIASPVDDERLLKPVSLEELVAAIEGGTRA
jgi:CheY-like chemotaxis protein